MTFASLGLIEPLLKALAALNFEEPTPVQRAAIPHILHGVDLWASAQTGSGKTAAFVLPMLQTLSLDPAPRAGRVRALVLLPTRELAAQIEQATRAFARFLPGRLKTSVVVGGVSINPQMMQLRGGADLVFATPGRLLDLLAHNALELSALQTLVLDEADRLFSLGFAEELEAVLACVPTACQKLLFSATFPAAVQALAEKILRSPVRLNIDSGTTPAATRIEQRVLEVDSGRRTGLLRHLLNTEAWPSVLIFVASRHAAEHLTNKLARAGVSAAALHGELSQHARTQALLRFRDNQVRVLIATDVAARGLDIGGLTTVINYDLPRSAVDYLHRIGRTGRAAETGIAVSFVSAESAAHFRLIERRHQLALTWERIAGFEPLDVVTEGVAKTADSAGGTKGRRKSKKDKLREALAAAAATKSPLKD